jgi:hypothetical protein
MKVGQKVQAKINNRWRDVTINRINKTTINVETPGGPVTLKMELVRTKPRKKTTPKKTVKKKTSSKTTTSTKAVKTKPKAVQIKTDQPRPGTKKNPWISLYDLRSQSAISNLDYETKVKLDGIIKNLIDDYGYKGY